MEEDQKRGENYSVIDNNLVIKNDFNLTASNTCNDCIRAYFQTTRIALSLSVFG